MFIDHVQPFGSYHFENIRADFEKARFITKGIWIAVCGKKYESRRPVRDDLKADSEITPCILRAQRGGLVGKEPLILWQRTAHLFIVCDDQYLAVSELQIENKICRHRSRQNRRPVSDL